MNNILHCLRIEVQNGIYIPGGTVTLASNDPFAFPVMDPSLLTTDFDVFALTQSIRDSRTFMESGTFSGLLEGRYGTLATAETDEEIAAALPDSVASLWHPTSTASMSPKGASWGVLDPDLRVKWVSGLRVVDASVFVSLFNAESD